MRLLLINQFYPPDVAPTGRVLHDLARTLVGRGHHVRVLCSRRSYDGSGARPPYAAREEMDGVHVRRLPPPRLGRGLAARASEQAVFLSALMAAMARTPRPDLVLSLTTPPYVGLVARALANLRGSAHAHWVMDVYPDVLAAHGWLRRGGLPFRTLQSLARLQLDGAALVLGLGPFQGRRVAQYARTDDVAWVMLWSAGAAPAPEDAIARVRVDRGWAHDDLVLLYSGNLGRGHALDEFLEAARRLGPSGPRWAFCGGGGRAAEVAGFARAHPDARVQSFPYVPQERLAETLGAGDVHLVGVRGAWQGLIVPSKVQAAFGAGRPVLLVGGRENEAAQWVDESAGGWRVEEGDVDGLLRALEAARDPAERQRRGAAARAYAQEHFDPARNCARIAELLERSVPRAG